ncbi:putative alpha-glucosidase maltase [Diaporthe ampelina]|uniref:Putative alpha-glucosidase maltase n=1 Tax=Diaporthe ampelina TaxID=1214573 RepID=A0A0G2FEB0_9PEZI|nr:putative alpha-glucosidase maltase [Diaporthe ampelina]
MSHNVDVNKHERIWWKDACIYQVYPASFKDSNGDGWGDIPGLISKLDYLEELGVDVVWLSPMFESPQVDMGYDISNYEAVYAPYGTIEDVEELVKGCHERNMKLILDLVANHTSVEHAWFKESRSSKNNPKRNWYFWRPARTWTWDEHTQEYYLHLYAPEQPDLNWDNEECRKAIYNSAMRFWLDKGIDGFRVDTVNKYSKVLPFVDAPVTDPNSYIQAAPHFWCNGPRIHEFCKEMKRDVLDRYQTFDHGPLVTVGELSLTPDPKGVLEYVSTAAQELSMVFQFDFTHLGMGNGFDGKYDYQPWKLSEMKQIVKKWQTFIENTDGWTTVFNENHDNGRSVSRFGNDSPEWREQCAKMLALSLIGQTGTLFLYQGQEIGMINAPREWPIEEYKDVEAVGHYAEAVRLSESGADPTRKERIMKGLQIMARDHARLPMQWDSSPHGGFTTPAASPWMRAHDSYPDINVQKQSKDHNSVLSFYKKALALRKHHRDVLIYGSFELLEPGNDETFIYRKRYDQKVAVVALNFTSLVQPIKLEGEDTKDARLLLSTYSEPEYDTLQPYEGRIYLNYESRQPR